MKNKDTPVALNEAGKSEGVELGGRELREAEALRGGAGRTSTAKPAGVVSSIVGSNRAE